MSLDYDTWQSDLETAIVEHMTTILSENDIDATYKSECEIPQNLNKPFVAIYDTGYYDHPSGGMNIVSDDDQSPYIYQTYEINVLTNKAVGGKNMRNKITSILSRIAFGQQLHTLLGEIDGIQATVIDQGVMMVSPTQDATMVGRRFTLTIRLLVPTPIATE